MATDAERQRRSRAHRAGDHSLCDSARCLAAGARRPLPPSEPGSVLASVQAFAAEMRMQDGDPRMIVLRCALALAAAIDEGKAPLAANIRALQGLSKWMEEWRAKADLVDEERAHMLVRRIKQHPKLGGEVLRGVVGG
jgi:hypothetical protein